MKKGERKHRLCADCGGWFPKGLEKYDHVYLCKGCVEIRAQWIGRFLECDISMGC